MYTIIHIKLIFCRCGIHPQNCDEIGDKLLMMEIEGGYNEDLRLRYKFGNLTSETSDSIEKLNKIPKDIDLNFNLYL